MEELRYRIFPWFVAEGTNVDGVTVGPEAKPDVNPSSNFPSLGCVTDGEPWMEYQDLGTVTVQKPKGFFETLPREIRQGGWLISLEKSNEFVTKLMLGIPALPVNGVAQVPFAKGHDNRQRGWLKISVLRDDNTVMYNQDLWCEVELEEVPRSGTQIQRPRLRARALGSPLDTTIIVS